MKKCSNCDELLGNNADKCFNCSYCFEFNKILSLEDAKTIKNFENNYDERIQKIERVVYKKVDGISHVGNLVARHDYDEAIDFVKECIPDISDEEAIFIVNRIKYQEDKLYRTPENLARVAVEVAKMNAKVECPFCHSKNTSKITMTSKAINTAMFGVLGTKRFKQWHCNNCNSDF